MDIESRHREPRDTPTLWWLTRMSWTLFFANVLAFALTPFLIWFDSGAWTLIVLYLAGPLLAVIGLALSVVQKDRIYRLANFLVVLAYAAWWGVMAMIIRRAG